MIALTIAGSDSSGGAGVQADLKTFAALGVHGASVITSLTAQNTSAVREIFDLPVEFIEAQFDAVHEDLDVNAAKTGMLSSKKIIETVARKVADYPLVVDPVMVAESGGRLMAGDAVSTLKKSLIPKALLVTPNIPEAQVLSGIKIRGLQDMKDACKIISKMGCAVIVKGGHLNATDILYYKGKFHVFKAEKFDFATHGSGCTFASAITAELAKGKDLVNAVAVAKDFITKAISASYKPGKGLMVVNQWGGILKNSESHLAVFELKKAVSRLSDLKGIHLLIPEVGANMVYAVPGAKNLADVAGVEGRIVRIGENVKIVGGVSMGTSKHVATIVLTSMKYDESIRSAMNIKYSENVIKASKAAGLTISTFSRKAEPKSVSTMEWGTNNAIEKFGGVPDVVYDLGAVGKEPMIRIFGKNPSDVLDKLERILGDIKEARW